MSLRSVVGVAVVVCGALVATMVVPSPTASAGDGSERDSWSIEQWQELGEQIRPDTQTTDPLSTTDARTRPGITLLADASQVSDGGQDYPQPAVEHLALVAPLLTSGAANGDTPAPTGDVSAEVGDVPVTVGVADGAAPAGLSVEVEVLPEATAEAAGVGGVLIGLDATVTASRVVAPGAQPGTASDPGVPVVGSTGEAPSSDPAPIGEPGVPTPAPADEPGSVELTRPNDGQSATTPVPTGESGSPSPDLAGELDASTPDLMDETDTMVGVPADLLLDVAVDYSSFADLYGVGWSDRLRLVGLPSCVAEGKSASECGEVTELGSVNDTDAQVLRAQVPAGVSLLAVAGSAEGNGGSWKATSLAPSSSWSVAANTGVFSWSYPLPVPSSSGGLDPELSLGYSSASVDGRVASTNNQSSWVGEGWDLWSGYIERSYIPCSEDMEGGNNASRKTGDLCWRSDNATLMFQGRSVALIKDVATGVWRAKDDDGTRIERLTGGWNLDNDREYWKMTKLDGTQYFFGRDKRTPTDPLNLNSAWTVPVYGNHPGDPCYATTGFADSVCQQAWRWNLDYVVDVNGNTITYTYAKETSHYGRNLNTAVSSYDRGGYLTSIMYGTRADVVSTTSPWRVSFEVSERCIPSATQPCSPADPTGASMAAWPDTPFDLLCTSASACPTVTSPAFFTRKRLVSVTSQTMVAGSYRPVDSWRLEQVFPDPGDGGTKVMWLRSVQHTGHTGASPIVLPPVVFSGVSLPNRVDTLGDSAPPMNRFRMNRIQTETGAILGVHYTPADCAPGNLPGSPESNTRRCFPVKWHPEGFAEPRTEYFHRYLVSSTTESGRMDRTMVVEVNYVYQGGAGWRYVTNEMVPEKDRTWSEFRGYESVDMITGSTSDPARPRLMTRYTYFRGLDGDKAGPGGGVKHASVDGITDSDQFAGMMRESTTYNGVNGAPVTSTQSWPWSSPPVATNTAGDKAYLTDIGRSDTHVWTTSGGVRTTRQTTEFDPVHGLPTLQDDQGDVGTPADDRCTRTQYTPAGAAGIVAPIRIETVGVACGSTPSRPADVVSDVRTFYDDLAFGAAPVRGMVTTSQEVKEYVGGRPVYVDVARSVYDDLGRPVRVTDALGRATTTTYAPSWAGPVSTITTTSPDPDGGGPLTAHTSTTHVEPLRSLVVKQVDANGKATTGAFDGLGRLTSVWLPGRVQGVDSATTTYAYTVSDTGVNTITTSTLDANANYQTTVELFDGMLRPVQVQAPSADAANPGRVVASTVYDSRGLAVVQEKPWFTTGAPTGTYLHPAEAVPGRTLTDYDGAGRVVREVFQIAEKDYSTTTTIYGGDHTTVLPPQGGVPTTTLINARGKVTELRQYTSGNGQASGAYNATFYTWDKADRLETTRDPAGNTWSNTYDLRGRTITSSDPDKGRATLVYDDAGQVTSTTDARGKSVHWTYDNLGRKTAMRHGSATGPIQASWSYDTLAKGQLTSSTRHVGTAAYVFATTGYDAAYRPTGQSVTVPASEGKLAGTYTTTYTYRVDGQVETYTNSAIGTMQAETVRSYFDSTGRIKTLSGGEGFGMYLVNQYYSPYGEVLQSLLGSRSLHSQTWVYENGTRRLERSFAWTEQGKHPITDLNYTYDQASNVTSIKNTPLGGTPDNQCFAYDGLNRLTEAWTPANGQCGSPRSVTGLGGVAPYWTSYTYDPVGNRTSTTNHTGSGDTTATYTYPAPGGPQPHAVTSISHVNPAGARSTSTYAYDQAGNTTTRAVPGSPSQTLTWDTEGELSQVTSLTGSESYLYTPDGDRFLRRSSGVTTIYLPGGQEAVLTGTTVSAVRYYQAGGKTIATRTARSAAQANVIISDAQGTPLGMINNSTNHYTPRHTDPFGNPRGAAPQTWPDDKTFLGKPLDSTGLVAIGARYYEPGAGRFISVDPVMDLTDPQQWNPYTYANNTPVTKSDPTGLKPASFGPEASGWGGKKPVYIIHPGVSKISPAVSKPPTQRARPSGFWNDVGAAVSAAAVGIGNAANEAAKWVGDKASDIGDWVYENRGTIATWAATGACFIPGVGQAACAGLQAGAFAVRTQQTIAEQGWNSSVALGIAFDAASIIPVGQALKVIRIKPPTAITTAAKPQTELVQRWMSRAELEATQSTGLLRGGREGAHFVTDSANHSAQRARQRLALPQTPEVRVQLEVPSGAFSPPMRVKPAYDMPGGGMERTATGSVSCRVVCVWE